VAAVLAVDTSGPVATFAVLMEDGRLFEEELESADGHAHKLFPVIERLLDRAGLGVGEMSCFAAGAGPGSFTGVRVALAAVKGLAHATGRPVVAVSNLAALAWFGNAPLRAPVIDARRGEVYSAVYTAEGLCVRSECVMVRGDFLSELPGEVEVIERGAQPLARAIARIAWRDYLRGLAVDAAIPEANYIRPPDIREPGVR
jgi:tRNA threonylcarbamoyladenosine biosynthesis protein TsaB